MFNSRRRIALIALAVAFALCVLSAVLVHKLRSRARNTDAAIAQYNAGTEKYPALIVVATVDYAQEIKPVLRERCAHCHGPNRQSGRLRVDTIAALLKGGRGGPAIVPGQVENSLLIQRIVEDDGRMPLGERPLDAAQIEKLRRWINEGAQGPLDEAAPAGGADHWAFRPPVLPPIPASPHAASALNPIDAFLDAARERQGIRRVARPMDRGRLLRRVSIDLTGLPPSPHELRVFLDDPSADAYPRAVDRLLASNRYGERWARHWMDVWRYADEDGRREPDGKLKEVQWSSPLLWRWRDWIIAALNEDKGYDHMVLEMLAGDEFARNDPKVLAATGFLVRNRNTLDRHLWLSTTIDHTAKAFLAVSMGCAKCHDHKYDAITQREYYQFRAIFEPHDVIDRDFGGTPEKVAHVFDAYPYAPTYLLDRGNELHPVKSGALAPGVPKVLGGPPLNVAGASSRDSTGRRLALARWLIDEHNPLTARVAVNHVWQRHFGRGLVDTPSDFGARGHLPTHPELLDWLAVELRQHRWSLKWLHRLIVTSEAYCRHDAPSPDLAHIAARDPDNVWLWRMNARRMEAEVVRDALLFLAGRLDETVGGPSESPAAAERSTRRSLYFRTSRAERVEFLSQFDPASPDECYQRHTSVVPQQALALVNSRFVWEAAGAIADRLRAAGDDSVPAVFQALLCRPPSGAETAECERFVQDQRGLLAAEGLSADQAAALARHYLVHALINHNDFITVR